MSRALTIGIGAGLCLAAAVAIAVVYVLTSFDAITKSAVERYGSAATQATVRLQGVEISPTTGRGALRGLLVGNPAGFNSPSALRVAGIRIDIDESTVTESTIVIDEIVVDQPLVTYEIGRRGSNIEALHRNVNAYAGAAKQDAGKSAAEDTPAGDEDDITLVVRRLRVTNGTVKVSAGGLGGGDLSAALPPILLRDVGKNTGGVTPAEMIELVVNALSWRISASVATLDLKNMLGTAGAGLVGAVRGAVEGTADVPALLKRETGSIGDTLKGIVPKTD